MTDDKFTDTDIAKALKCCANKKQCSDCPFCRTSREPCYITLAREAASLLDHREAEIERLKKGWRADVVETANAKAEVIKEFAEKVENELAPTMTALFVIGEILVDVSKSHLSSEEAVKRIRNKLKVNNAIGSLGGLNKLLDKLAKELTEAIP